MATYTDIDGQGKLLNCTLSGVTTFTVVPPETQFGSVYLTLETVRNSSGSFDSTTPTNAIGTYDNFTNCGGLVTSSYIFSVVNGEGTGSFDFTPSSTVASGTAYVRGTGGITLEVDCEPSIPYNPILGLEASSYSSGPTWIDGSGNGNDATIFNSPTNDGTSFILNGSDQYFRVPSGFADFTNGITILSFADFGVVGDWERILDFGNGVATDNILLSRKDATNDLTFEVFDSALNRLVDIELTNGVINGGWGFYGVRLDGSNYKIFNQTINATGVETNLPSNIVRNGNYIGWTEFMSDDPFESKIGMVVVYDKALTDVEIDAFYNLYKGDYGL